MEFPTIAHADGHSERQAKLNQSLNILASQQIAEEADCCNAARFFLELYSDSTFRHMYSQVFGAMGSEDDLEKELENCTCLSDNLNQIAAPRCPSERADCPAQLLKSNKQFLKLYDHVDLEVRRISSERKVALELICGLQAGIEALGNAKCGLEDAVKKSNHAEGKLRKARKKINALQKETIAILGIFAAIVLAFNGAIGLSVSAVEAAGAQSGLQNLFLMVILGGFILVNGIAILLLFVWLIVRDKELANNSSIDTSENDKHPRPSMQPMLPQLFLALAIVFIDVVFIVAALYIAAGRVPPIPLP